MTNPRLLPSLAPPLSTVSIHAYLATYQPPLPGAESYDATPTSPTTTKKQYELPAGVSDGAGGAARGSYPPLPAELYTTHYVMLNIGGISAIDGWFNVNSQAVSYNMANSKAHLLRDMHDLHGVTDNSVAAIYASHTLEHNSFGNGMLDATLKEWHRVLRPGGLLCISVPDLRTLASLYLDPTLVNNPLLILIYPPHH